MQKKITLTLLSLALALILSACSGSAFIPSGWTGLTVEQDTVYLAHNQYVYAIRLSDGNMVWRYPERGQANKTFYAPPTVTEDGSQLLAGSYNNFLYSLDPATGEERWPFRSEGHIIAGPLTTGQGIYVPSGDRVLYALDLQGKERWSFTASGPLWAQPIASQDEQVVYVTSMDHFLYALNAGTGELLWSKDLSGAIVGSPAISEDGSTLYVGTFGSGMNAVRADNGSLIWNSATDGWVWSPPAIYQDNLYFGDLNGQFYAMSAADGAILWQVQPDGPITGAPLATEEAIYVPTEAGTLVAYDHAGERLWTQTIGGKIYTSPVAAGDLILVAPIETDFRLVALNLSGARQWDFTPP